MGVYHGGSGLGGGSTQRLGGAGHEVHTLHGVDALGLGHGVQAVVQGFVTEVVHLEAVGVLTHPGGVVVKLYLGHITAVHRQVSLGGHGVVGVGQAGALIPGGVVQSVGVYQRHGGAHEECPHQGIDLGAVGIAQAVGRGGILLHQGGDARQVGRGHGGAAHDAVAAAVNGGVDVAARGGDVRLQGQGGGHAPGGEVAHLVSGLAGNHTRLSAGLQGQVGILCQLLQNVGAAEHGDGSTGDVHRAIVQVHADDAGLVVVDQAGNRTGSLGVFTLFRKGDVAPLYQGNLPGHIHLAKFLGGSGAGHRHHLVGLASQGLEQGILAVGGIHIGDVVGAAYADVIGDNAHILHAGHGHGVGVGAGGAQNAVVGVGGQVGIEAEGVAVAGGGLVTGGDAQHRAGGLDPTQNLIGQVVTGGEAGGGTQAHVHHVAAQLQGIFQGGQPVGGIDVAVPVHDLHDCNLGIGGYAHHVGAFHLVGGGNTGYMGAVFIGIGAGVVHIQAHVAVVEGEGHLGGAVQVLRSQTCIHLGGVQASHQAGQLRFGHAVAVQGILGQSGKVGMVRIQAAVDDGNGHALAGVALGPGVLPADHHAVGAGLGGQGALLYGAGLISGLEHYLADPVQGSNFAHLSIGDVGGEAVHQPAELLGDLQSLPIQDGVLNLGDYFLLVGLQGAQLSGGLGIVNRTAVGRHHGLPFQDDDDPDFFLGADVKVLFGDTVFQPEGQAAFHTLQLLNHQLGAGFFRGSFRRFLSGDGGQSHGEDHAQSQQPGIYTLHFHYAPLLIRL